MDYAEYVLRRPPSPPPLRFPHPPPPLSCPSPAPLSSSSSSPPSSSNPQPSLLRPQTIRSEYYALVSKIQSSTSIQVERDRHDAVRIRLEDLLTRADLPARRVLYLALQKCNANIDGLVYQITNLDEAQARMRLIESKHFLGRNPYPLTPTARELHVKRDTVASLVDHIVYTLHDQVRIHHFLTVVMSKLVALKSVLADMDRVDRPSNVMDIDKSSVLHATAVTDIGERRKHGFIRRNSRGAVRSFEGVAGNIPDRVSTGNTGRASVLRSQRSLPRRSENGFIPLVVKRAWSYNASGRVSEDGKGDASWWGGGEVVSSESNLALPDAAKSSWHRKGRDTPDIFKFKPAGEEIGEDEIFPPVSPVSQCTVSDGSGRTNSRGKSSRRDSAFDRSVLVDIDSLCTEASCALSSSRVGEENKPLRNRSVPSVAFGRKKGLPKLKFGSRGKLSVKKAWLEINELYGIVLTHGPHLVEENIVTRASVSQGILGPWNSRGGKSGSFRSGLQAAAVVEASRKIESVVLWQQRLIVAIRKDYMGHRKALRQADSVISQEFVQAMEESRR